MGFVNSLFFSVCPRERKQRRVTQHHSVWPPRECKQSRATQHHSVWPTCQNEKETAFPKTTAITKRAGNFLPNGIPGSQGHSACRHKGFVFPAFASQRLALALFPALAVIGFRFLRLLRVRGSVLQSCFCKSMPRSIIVSCTCGSAPCFFGKTEWRWVFRQGWGCRLLGSR